MSGAARVPVRLPDGSAGTVPAGEVEDLPEGSELLSGEEAHAEQRAAQYGGAIDKAGAFGTGGLRSLTGGASDHAMIGIERALDGDEGAERMRTALRENAEEHPGYTGAGELTGLVAPSLLTGGASGGARLLGGYGALVGRAGQAAEGLAGRALGREALTLGGRALQRAAVTAAGAGTEAALLGASHEVSEAALGDHELTAEHMLSSMAQDFLLGAGGGAVLGAGGEILKAGARRATAAGLGRLGDETIAQALQRKSNELYYKAAGPTQKMASRVEQTFEGGTAGLGAKLRPEVEEALGRSAGSREDFLEAAPKIQKKGAKLIKDALERLDDAADLHERRPTAGDVFGRLKSEVLEPLQRSTSGAAGENAVAAWATRAGRTLGMLDDAGELVEGAAAKPITYRQIHKLRREVDDLVFGANDMRDTMSAKALKQVRDILEDRIQGGATELASASGEPALLRDYAHGKQVYQAGKELEKAATRGVAQTKTNRLLSLTDNIVGSAGGAVGAMVGGAPGALLGGGLSAFANHVIRQKFDFVASNILAKAAEIGTIARISSDSERQLAQGVKGFLRRGAGASPAIEDIFGARKGESRGAAYLRFHASLQQAQNPDRQAQAVAQVMGDSAPRTTAALGKKLALGVAYLASKLPGPTSDPYHMQQHLETPEPPTEDELDVAEQQVRAFFKPHALLHDMARGELSAEAVDVMKMAYPEIYARVQREITRELADPRAPALDWDQQVQLELLFDRPTDEALDPSVMADVQGVHAAHAAAAAQAAGGGGTGSVGRDDRAKKSLQTAAQRLEGE